MAAPSVTAPRQETPQPLRFTVEDYHRMGEAGIFTEDDRVELLEGEIYAMSPINDPHAGSVNRLTIRLARSVGEDILVSVQNPVRLAGNSEPQPDLALIRATVTGVPRAADALVVIEVADSSRAYDRGRKMPLYAAAGIPELWLVDLVARAIERYSDPGDGRYRQLTTFGPGETLTSTVLPGIAIAVDEVLA